LTLKQTCPQNSELPRQIRVSLGTAIVLGLLDGKLDAEPTTAYLMTYKAGKCSANCGFCPQARSSKSSTEMLSRVSWPTYPLALLLTALASSTEKKTIKRVCIQALNYPEVFRHLEAIVKEIKKQSAVPVSVSCQPQTKANMERLASAGVNRLGIALDAATKEVFDKIKGVGTGAVYRWDDEFRQLREASSVFGKGNVSTHIIIGLGETEQDAMQVIQRCYDLGILPALFAFTPVRGTALEEHAPPSLSSYRRIQLARYLIVNNRARVEDMQFSVEGDIVSFGLADEKPSKVVESGLPFETSGCPNCNRPFYNEKPSGNFYNYPRKLKEQEIEKIKKELQ
jgi:lipoyl synthase